MPQPKTKRPKKRTYTRCAAVPLYKTTIHEPRGDNGNGLIHMGGHSREHDGSKIVRYSIEWNSDELQEVIQRAAGNKRRFAKSGPITVYVHPDD